MNDNKNELALQWQKRKKKFAVRYLIPVFFRSVKKTARTICFGIYQINSSACGNAVGRIASLFNTRLNIVDCLDNEKSGVKLNSTGDLIISIERLVLNFEKLLMLPESRRQIFCVVGSQFFEVVNEAVAKKLLGCSRLD